MSFIMLTKCVYSEYAIVLHWLCNRHKIRKTTYGHIRKTWHTHM